MKTFDIIPAIDILDGKCVRLTQGKYDKVEEFSANPKEIAKKWVDAGAERLHVVDLNGAKDGYPVNFKVISNIIEMLQCNVSSHSVKVQVGGGIRTKENIKDYLNEGISYLIIGTKAFTDKAFLNEALSQHGEKIIIGLDLKNNKVALSGWQETIEISKSNLNEQLSNVKQIIHTDIAKDGMLSGPNLKSVEEIAAHFPNSGIIVSGGISKLEDIKTILNIKKQRYFNISGAILGKSLYKETINLKSAIELVKKEFSGS